MRRRFFLGFLGAAAGAAEPRENLRYFAIAQYRLPGAADAASLHRHLQGHHIHNKPLLILEALAAPYLPQFTIVHGASSLDGLRRLEGPLQPQSIDVLEAAGSPAWNAAPRAGIWEWRVYHAPAFRRDPLAILQCAGIRPAMQARALPEQRLAYLIPFDDLAQRGKAWAALASDPQWMSIAAPGRLSASMHVSLFRPAAYGNTR